jgi:signal transduction histidine kinase
VACLLDFDSAQEYDDSMKFPRLYQVVMILGALAALAAFPLASLVGGRAPGQSPGLSDLIAILLFLTGAFVFWKRPDHPAARRLLAFGGAVAAIMASGHALTLLALQDRLPAWFWVGSVIEQMIEMIGAFLIVALFTVFPDGLYQRAYERWIVWASSLIVLSPVLLLLAYPSLQFNAYLVRMVRPIPSPLYIPSLAWLGPPALSVFHNSSVLALVAAGLLLLRYRRFGREQRLQILWPLLALLICGLTTTAIALIYGSRPWPAFVSFLFYGTVALIPIAIGVGLLRHRLFDIEVVTRKSLVYGALWLAILLGYVGLTAALGIAAGAYLPVSLAILLAIVATQLFQPSRQRLEQMADRWVFGERLNGYELLTRFGATLESAFDLHELIPRVAGTVREGLNVAWVRVSLQQGAFLEVAGAEAIDLHTPGTPSATAPLVHSGEQLGMIECGPKLDGSFGEKDRELLASLSRQAALAVRNARLADELAARLTEIERQARELAASRTRLVQAGEEERRRIERNIHDGVQQELVALMAKIRLARNQITRDPQKVERTLAELQEDTRQALDDLRELAHGIHPPLLSDRGLLEAIEARIARLPMGVTIETDGVGRGDRYAEEIEGAAYFFVCEGLANVLKHAAAGHIVVHLSLTPGCLKIEVNDNGRGFDAGAVVPSGLRGLSDRIEALGGDLRVVSQPASGTTLVASLPLQERRDV